MTYNDDDYEISIDESDIEARLSNLNCPVGDEYFADSKQLPYCVYHTPEAQYYGDDCENTYRKQTFRVELYTLSKRDKRRNMLFKLFKDVPFSVEEESGGYKNYYYVGITFKSLIPLDYDNDDDE